MFSFTLRKCVLIISERLAITFDNCLHNGHFSATCKSILLIPIPKKSCFGDLNDIKSSILLSNFGKIREPTFPIFLNRQYSCLNPLRQFGFESFLWNSKQAILYLQTGCGLAEILNHMENWQLTVSYALYHEKSFDLVWKDELLLKLIQTNCPLPSFRILVDFLSNNTCPVRFTVFPVDSGVPQGSILPHS